MFENTKETERFYPRCFFDFQYLLSNGSSLFLLCPLLLVNGTGDGHFLSGLLDDPLAVAAVVDCTRCVFLHYLGNLFIGDIQLWIGDYLADGIYCVVP